MRVLSAGLAKRRLCYTSMSSTDQPIASAAVAQRLGRRGIACDQSRLAVAITADRLTWQVEEQTAETVGDAVAQAGVTARQITHDVRKQAEELEKRGHAMLGGQSGR